MKINPEIKTIAGVENLSNITSNQTGNFTEISVTAHIHGKEHTIRLYQAGNLDQAQASSAMNKEIEKILLVTTRYMREGMTSLSFNVDNLQNVQTQADSPISKMKEFNTQFDVQKRVVEEKLKAATPAEKKKIENRLERIQRAEKIWNLMNKPALVPTQAPAPAPAQARTAAPTPATAVATPPLPEAPLPTAPVRPTPPPTPPVGGSVAAKLEKRIHEQEKVIAALNQEIQSVKEHSANEFEGMLSDRNERIGNLLDERAFLEEALTKLKDERRDLKTQNKFLRNYNITNEVKLEEAAAREEKLKQELESVKADNAERLNSLENEHIATQSVAAEEFQKQFDTLQEELSKVREQLKEATENARQTSSGKVEQLQNKIKTLEEEIAELKMPQQFEADPNELEILRASHSEEIEKLQQEIEDKLTLVEALTKKFIELKESYTQENRVLEEQLDDALTQIEKLQTKGAPVETPSQPTSISEEKYAKLENDHDYLTSININLYNETKELCLEIEKLEKELEQFRLKKDVQQEQAETIVDLFKQRDNLKAAKEKFETQVKELQNKNEQWYAQSAEFDKIYAESILSKNAEKSMGEELEKMKVELEKKKEELENLHILHETEYAELETKNAELEKTNKEFIAANAEFDKANAELETENAKLKDLLKWLDKTQEFFEGNNTALDEFTEYIAEHPFTEEPEKP